MQEQKNQEHNFTCIFCKRENTFTATSSEDIIYCCDCGVVYEVVNGKVVPYYR